jgi:hypothetical protein
VSREKNCRIGSMLRQTTTPRMTPASVPMVPIEAPKHD